MDVDAFVSTVLGEEGKERCKRLGLLLLVVSLVLIVIILALPIFSTVIHAPTSDIEEDSWNYFRMWDDRTLWEPFLEKVNLSLVSYAILAIIGALLLLVGLGRVDLRRFMPWHPQVRWTMVYATIMFVAIVGVSGMATVWGTTFHPEEWTYMDYHYEEASSSPAGLVVTVLGLLVVLGLLFLTGHSVTVSSRRGDPDHRARSLGMVATGLILVSLVGLLGLRLGSILVVDYSSEFGYPGMVYTMEGTEPMTMMGIDLVAHLPEADASVERLDLFLGLIDGCLLISVLLATAAAVGASALGVGGRSRRVHLAISLPFLVVVLGLLAMAFAGAAFGQVQDTAEWYVSVPTLPIIDMSVDGSPGWGLYIALPLAAVLVVVSLLYARSAGRSVLLVAVGREPLPAPEGAVGAPAEPPKRAPGRPVSRGIALLVVIVAIMILAVSAGAYWMMGGDGDDGGSRTRAIEIESLEDFSHVLPVEASTLNEGSTEVLDVQSMFLQSFGSDNTTYFVDEISITLTWEDEPDRENPLATYENQPDRFGLGLHDYDGSLITMYDENSNEHGQQGEVMLSWYSVGEWIAWGDPSVEVRDIYTVVWGLTVETTVDMIEAGDLTAPRRPVAYVDDGNHYDLEVIVSGKVNREG